MDVATSSLAMTCIPGFECPCGPDCARTVYTGGATAYRVTVDGKCTENPCPNCGPPSGMGFSFLQIDGAPGTRGQAVKMPTQRTIDGLTCDWWQSNRSAIAPGAGVMNWYLARMPGAKSIALVRTEFVADSGPVAGTGSRDFSRGWQSPAPASAFATPKGCTPSPLPLHLAL